MRTVHSGKFCMPLTATLLLLWIPQAEAHLVTTGLGPVYDGIGHFMMSPDDLVPVIALALLAGLRGAEAGRRALFGLPVAWLLGCLAGAMDRGVFVSLARRAGGGGFCDAARARTCARSDARLCPRIRKWRRDAVGGRGDGNAATHRRGGDAVCNRDVARGFRGGAAEGVGAHRGSRRGELDRGDGTFAAGVVH